MADMQIPSITTLSGTLPSNTSDSETPMFSGVLMTNDATTLSGTIKNDNSTMLSGTLMNADNSILSGELANDTENPETLTGTVMDDDSEKLTGVLMTNLIRGYSAYEVAVQQGFDGTVEEWLSSLIGESVAITVVEDTENSYVIEFSAGDEVVRTPNLRGKLINIEQQIAEHDQSLEAHADIRSSLSDLNTRFNTYIDSTDSDLDQLSEIVDYIKDIRLFEIVDNLPSPQNADPKKIYILRSTVNEEVDNNG